MSARERLEARRRIERLLDEDRRRVAQPPEKAMTLVGWLDHDSRRCSLKGRSNNLVLRGCRQRPATNGRATQTDLRSEKKNSSSIKTNLRVQFRVHVALPPTLSSHPSVETGSEANRWKGQEPTGEGAQRGEVQPERLLCSGRAAARRPPEAAPVAATLRTAARR